MTAEQMAKAESSGTSGKLQRWEEALGGLYRKFRDYADKAVKKFDDEDIHQARVNSRKLLTLLSMLDPGHTSGLYPLFKKAQKRLGKVRDEDVLIEAFKLKRRDAKTQGDKESAALLKAVIELRKQKRKRYRKKLADKLPLLANEEMDAAWEDFIRTGLPAMVEKTDPNRVMRELEVAFEQNKQRCKTLFRKENSPSAESFDALHKLRIAAKELRYTANAASFALDQKFHAHEQLYKGVQSELGEINDKRVWLETIEDIGPEELGAGKKAWERLTGSLKAEIEEALRANTVVDRG